MYTRLCTDIDVSTSSQEIVCTCMHKYKGKFHSTHVDGMVMST